MRPRHVECSTRRGRFFYFYSVLFRNAVVSDDVRSLFQNILLVSCLPWVIVVDHIRHTVFISTVRHYADMSFFDRHDLSEPFRALYAQYAAKNSEAVQTTKNAPEFLLKRFYSSRRLPIFTRRFQRTIFGTSELNFCVRNGNRWNLTVIDTDRSDWPSITYMLYFVQCFLEGRAFKTE